MAISILDKVDFKSVGDKENHYIIISGLIHQEHITIVNVYAPNIGA